MELCTNTLQCTQATTNNFPFSSCGLENLDDSEQCWFSQIPEQTIYVSRPQFDRSTGVVTCKQTCFHCHFIPLPAYSTMDTLLKGMQQSV